MKLSSRDAAAYFRAPDANGLGILIYGADPMRVAIKRQDVIKALVGPDAEEEMRLTRLSAGDIRKDPALLLDAIKAQGFFPGPRVVFVEDAGDGTTKALEPALADWSKGDAQIIVTAGQLAARSSLRKLFEGHPSAKAAGIYDDPPTRDEISLMLREAGLTDIPNDVMGIIGDLARSLDPGDFRQTIEKLSLYKYEDAAPLTLDDISACTPQSQEADMDDVLHCAAEAKAQEIGPILSRLYAQGVTPVGLCIAANRHFRILHIVASDSGGPAAGINKLRPPVYGPRKDRIQRQAGKWGKLRLERALSLLIETDLQLRSADKAPDRALVERALIKLAMIGAR